MFLFGGSRRESSAKGPNKIRVLEEKKRGCKLLKDKSGGGGTKKEQNKKINRIVYDFFAFFLVVCENDSITPTTFVRFFEKQTFSFFFIYFPDCSSRLSQLLLLLLLLGTVPNGFWQIHH